MQVKIDGSLPWEKFVIVFHVTFTYLTLRRIVLCLGEIKAIDWTRLSRGLTTLSTIIEPPHDIHVTNKMTYAPIEDLDQLGHPPSPIRVFAVRSVGS